MTLVVKSSNFRVLATIGGTASLFLISLQLFIAESQGCTAWRVFDPRGEVWPEWILDPSEGSSRTLGILQSGLSKLSRSRAVAEPLGSSRVLYQNPWDPLECSNRTLGIIQSDLSEVVRSSRGP